MDVRLPVTTDLPKLKKRYDLAISYMNGPTNYYVIDKVTAKKKILWIHNEFEKLDVNYDYERNYYEKADRVVTISQDCVDSFARVYPDLRKKALVLENISSPETIRNAAKLVPEDDFFQYEGLKIVSIGRLAPQKGYEIAIDAAAKIKKQGIEFVWYILGEGELRAELERLIKTNELVKEVKLVGIKENPYPYIAGCDIFAQTSRYEGKSIALDEAKILNKPILVTNYATVGASINNGENGLIVGGVRRMCMVVRKKQLITFIMTVLMFHLSFIAFKEEYFVGFLKIQRYAAIALIGLVFININAFIKKENCLINIILILLSVSVGYSSWMNRDLSGYGLINIIFAVVKTVAPFIALEYACEVREEKTAIRVLLACTLIYCFIADVHGFSTGVIGQDKGNLLLGNKFNLSYLHIFSVALYANMREEKAKKVNTTLIVLWGIAFFIAITSTCTTAAVACVLFAVLYLFQEKFEKIILNPIVAIVLILFCDSLLFINSAILTWGPINSFIVDFLHEDTTLTGRMTIYQNVLKLLMMNPWFGFGAENNHIMSYTVARGGNTQNGLADIIVSYGIVGSFLILTIMCIAMIKQKDRYSKSYMALLYTFIVISMVEITLGSYFLIVLALLMFIGKSTNYAEDD